MGQAKNRIRRDPYSDIKDHSFRGIIMAPPVVPFGEDGFTSIPIDLQDLRTNLLFFDRIDYPDNNAFSLGTGFEIDFLIKEGIVQRTKQFYKSADATVTVFGNACMDTFKQHEERHPGQWSLDLGHTYPTNANDISTGRGALLSIYNAIPVPHKDVPLHDILEFRTRRRDELISLRTHLEEIYQKIGNNHDQAISLNTEISKLQISINDYTNSIAETRLSKIMLDMTMNFNVATVITTAAGSYASGLTLTGAAISAGFAGLSLTIGDAIRWRKNNPSPFRYIKRYHQQLF
ncbi:MAG: hypothetical protein H2042_01015 [Rhizobiales bacterium]|nr:hypothetical protein [Hyphomicrobiales bacterium]